MGDVWLLVAMLGLGSMAIKGLGPTLLPGRSLPPLLAAAATALPVAMIAALIVGQTLGTAVGPAIDARVPGVAIGIVLLVLRAPPVLAVAAAAVVTALVRAVL